jgi:hypothetical protein
MFYIFSCTLVCWKESEEKCHDSVFIMLGEEDFLTGLTTAPITKTEG